MDDDPLRAQLVRMLDWEEAHIGFDKAVDGLPSDKRGALAPGVEHSVWQLAGRGGRDRRFHPAPRQPRLTESVEGTGPRSASS